MNNKAARPIGEQTPSDNLRDNTSEFPSARLDSVVTQWLHNAVNRAMAIIEHNREKANMAKENPPIWRSDVDGKLYHEECFDEGETKVGFTQLETLDDLDEDSDCASCGGIFLEGVYDPGADDEDDE